MKKIKLIVQVKSLHIFVYLCILVVRLLENRLKIKKKAESIFSNKVVTITSLKIIFSGTDKTALEIKIPKKLNSLDKFPYKTTLNIFNLFILLFLFKLNNRTHLL